MRCGGFAVSGAERNQTPEASDSSNRKMEAKAQRRLTRDLLKVITNRCRLFSVNVQFKFLALASLHLETIYPERVGIAVMIGGTVLIIALLLWLLLR